MVDGGFKELAIVLAGPVLIVIGFAVRFSEELLSDFFNVETTRLVSTSLIIFGVIILVVVVFFVLLLWDRSR